MEDQGKKSIDRATELAEKRTDLAMERTIIAEERTLMAWIRTSISLIGFGFTIYKFFQYLQTTEQRTIGRTYTVRNLGLTLIALGTLALAGAAWQHRDVLKRLGAEEGKRLWSLSFIVAILVILIGVLAFIGVLTGTGPY
jgi:putative membrane protein